MKNVMWLAIKSGEDFAVSALIENGQLVEDANRPPWLMICVMIWSRESLALWEMLDAWHSVLVASQIYTDLSHMD